MRASHTAATAFSAAALVLIAGLAAHAFVRPAAAAGLQAATYVLDNVTSNGYRLLGYPPQNKRNALPVCSRAFTSTGPAFDITTDAVGNVYVPAIGRPLALTQL